MTSVPSTNPLCRHNRAECMAEQGWRQISVAGQIYRSTDCGHTWTKLSREFGEVRAVALAA